MRAYLVAGEPSGDRLGAALMGGLAELSPGVEFAGVGGALMGDAGLSSLFPMEELSVMGLAEVLPKLRHLFRRRDEVVADVLARKPDVLITIDSPDFGLRVARKVRAAEPNIRTVHYVAPSVWAWRPGRAAKMARYIDHVLALLPFEPPYMEAAGMECDFVGHPVVNEPVARAGDVATFRSKYGIEGEMILMLPGSRGTEIERLVPRFGETLRHVQEARPGIRAVVPMVPHLVGRLRDMTADWPGAPVLLDPTGQDTGAFNAEKRAAFAAADVALAASGTVSLELAAAGTPMVISYDMGWLSRKIVPRLLQTDTVTLVNLVSESRVVPEFLAERCQPALMAPALLDVLARPEAQAEALSITMERLGRDGEAPGLRAARVVLERMGGV